MTNKAAATDGRAVLTSVIYSVDQGFNRAPGMILASVTREILHVRLTQFPRASGAFQE